MAETRNYTCIICPKGCDITVTLDDKGEITSITGQTCRRGEEYARNEITNPVRTLTTTVAIEGGGVIPVRTNKAIPKRLLFDAMKEINGKSVPKTAKAGYVVIKGLLGTDADVVTVMNADEQE